LEELLLVGGCSYDVAAVACVCGLFMLGLGLRDAAAAAAAAASGEETGAGLWRCEDVLGGTTGLLEEPRGTAEIVEEIMGELVAETGSTCGRGVVILDVFDIVGEGCCGPVGVFGELALLVVLRLTAAAEGFPEVEEEEEVGA
jgi:hypothetical protein